MVVKQMIEPEMDAIFLARIMHGGWRA
jgi:hypothetical protein